MSHEPVTTSGRRPDVVNPDTAAMWRRLLPSDVCFSYGEETSVLALTPAERLSLGVAGDRRVREFAAGRSHARRALAALGMEVADLRRGPDGRPVWPDGVVGSIAHTVEHGRVCVIAAVARAGNIAALGVDIESGAGPAPHSWSSLMLQDEIDRILLLPADARAAEVLALWCAKEAVAKASGRTGDLRGIRGIAIQRQGADGAFGANLIPGPAPSVGSPVRWEGRTAIAGGKTAAAVVRRALHSAGGASSVYSPPHRGL